MKLYLDTNVIGYMCKLTELGEKKKKKLKITEYECYLQNSELITDYVVLFEAFSQWPNYKLDILDTLLKYNTINYTPAFNGNKKISKAFRNLITTRNVEKFYKTITPIVAKQYSTELSAILWNMFEFWFQFMYYHTENKSNDNNKIFENLQVKLYNVANHTTNVFTDNICSLINNNNFSKDSVTIVFANILNTTAYHINKIQFDKYKEDVFLFLYDKALDNIYAEPFKDIKNCDYSNFVKYKNNYEKQFSKLTKIKLEKDKNWYNFNRISREEFTDIARNKLLNQILLGRNTSITFNDIKDSMIARNYLCYMQNEKPKEETYLLTFDKKFKDILRKCKTLDYQKSINFIDSLFETV